MPISLDEINRALMVRGRAEGYCWCVVPLRQMVDVRGMTHAPCGLPITDASYDLTARQRGDAVNDYYGPAEGRQNAGNNPDA